MAFERAQGPLNGEWDAEALSSIQEQLQQISYLLGQAHFTDKTHKRGPVGKPERFNRPWEALKRIPVPLEDLADEEEWLPLSEDELLEVKIDPQEAEAGDVE
ncbi:MAG TPA: hypothetical protein VLA89_14150 [Gemmatimonadales bacterium]|nr:hypothetical protein [Gemmatimonadales bacterium]